MAKLSRAEQSLVDLTNLRQYPDEDREAFLARLTRAAHAVSKEKWDKLPKEARNWVNKAVDSLNAEKLIRDFHEVEDDEEEADVGTKDDDKDKADTKDKKSDKKATPTGGDKKKSAASKDGGGDKKAAEKKSDGKAIKANGAKTDKKKGGSESKGGKSAKADKAEKAEKAEKGARQPKADGQQMDLLRIIAKNPTMSAQDLLEALKGKGLKSSMATARWARNAYRSVTQVLRELGQIS